MWADAQRDGRPAEYIGGALCESSVIPFLLPRGPRRKVTPQSLADAGCWSAVQ